MEGKKTGGRKLGTPNKVTRDLRMQLKLIVAKQLDELPELINQIEDPEKKLNLFLKLLPFIVPKVKNIYHNEGEVDIFEFGVGNGFNP